MRAITDPDRVGREGGAQGGPRAAVATSDGAARRVRGLLHLQKHGARADLPRQPAEISEQGPALPHPRGPHRPATQDLAENSEVFPLADTDLRRFAVPDVEERPLLARSLRSAFDRFMAATAVNKSVPCTTCHMDQFQGDFTVPRLAGQQRDYLVKTLMDFRLAPARTTQPCPELMSSLTPEQIQRLPVTLRPSRSRGLMRRNMYALRNPIRAVVVPLIQQRLSELFGLRNQTLNISGSPHAVLREKPAGGVNSPREL